MILASPLIPCPSSRHLSRRGPKRPPEKAPGNSLREGRRLHPAEPNHDVRIGAREAGKDEQAEDGPDGKKREHEGAEDEAADPSPRLPPGDPRGDEEGESPEEKGQDDEDEPEAAENGGSEEGMLFPGQLQDEGPVEDDAQDSGRRDQAERADDPEDGPGRTDLPGHSEFVRSSDYRSPIVSPQPALQTQMYQIPPTRPFCKAAGIPARPELRIRVRLAAPSGF